MYYLMPADLVVCCRDSSLSFRNKLNERGSYGKVSGKSFAIRHLLVLHRRRSDCLVLLAKNST
jgi:hypothetical protein